MAIYLKDPEVDRLAREVAALERVSITEAVARALAARKHALAGSDEERLARIRRIQEDVKKLPILDPRDPDEILYDEFGVPK